MRKRTIIGLILIVIILVGGIFFFNHSKTSEDNDNASQENQNEEENNNTSTSDNDSDDLVNTNSVVVYFTATGNTETIANMIGSVTDSEVIELVPNEQYTDADLNYHNDNSRANREQNDDNARPEIKNNINNLDLYDTIYLGYPIWWGDVPKIILTFLDTYDLSGKTIIPFCTSSSSGISTSVNTLRNYNSNINVLDGRRLSSSTTEDEVSSWINDIN